MSVNEWKFSRFLNKRLCKIRNIYSGTQNALFDGGITERRECLNLSSSGNCIPDIWQFDRDIALIREAYCVHYWQTFDTSAPIFVIIGEI